MARGILSSLLNAFLPSRRPSTSTAPGPAAGASGPGRYGASATREIAPPRKGELRITYAPVRDSDPDAGEIVWTWVPYAENDGRGKDRPVLVIGRRDADTVYAVKLTSKAHDGRRDFLPIGSGAWDPQGRPSWVDIDQFYLVHHDGMRREAAALDAERFVRVAAELHRRYGWVVGEPR
ncbi:type II toxin-antitoxin system PemK/MazF family toxin [Microbacterium jejuense]|uniref:Type II toxin-antitoxin system PemK/MazF family toxin n=1 Tax=Microbacterium jejuense TaxID=1263637 RepID=A0ABS7HRX1_9MICO|nr:type II toxin-antitoxin system PemK/MazF family toxin [Microbacterium jejuense]MBW9094658.1 type II toxin-antitoxin system PemK/MazF family toxin [Microbacterium jejuense]